MRVGLIILLLLTLTTALVGAAPTTAPSNAVIISVDRDIDKLSQRLMFQHFEQARKLGVKTVILRLRTDDGLVSSALEMSQFIKQADDLHIIAFIDDKAYSAGAMIAVACDEIVMKPHSWIGDAAPIGLPIGSTEQAKIVSPVMADFRASAERNGYDVALVEAMVSVDRVIYWVENSKGERRIVDATEYARLTETGEWKAVPGVTQPIDSAQTLLTIQSDRAVALGLAKSMAPSADALALERGYTITQSFGAGSGDKLIAAFDHLGIRFVLLLVFFLAMFIAMHAPGHGGAEAVALVTAVLLFGVPLLTGYAQWWEIVAIVIGLVLLSIEIFVTPGFGVLGISGIILIGGGLVLTFVGNDPGTGWWPSMDQTWKNLRNGSFVVVGGLAAAMLLWFWLARYLPQIPYFNRLILTAGGPGTPEVVATVPGPIEWPRIGSTGRAMTNLRPHGAAAFYDEALEDDRVIEVVSDGSFIRANTSIVVEEIDKDRVIVRTQKA